MVEDSGSSVDPANSGIDRRKAIGTMAAGAGAAWTAPSVLRMAKAGAATGSNPTTTTTTQPPGDAVLRIQKTGPGGAFTNQAFSFSITVSNVGTETATAVQVVDDLPSSGSFVSSSPAGTVAGNTLTVDVGDLAAGASTIVTVVWKAPSTEGTVLNTARASADNAATVGATASVQIGTVTVTDGGVASAGTGLRNRDHGTLAIADVPADATVTRAVLVWALLYTGSAPANQITLDGTVVTADLTATISKNLCWGDTDTIGYAADVTSLITGNGNYEITDAINGIIRVDDQPGGVLPYTDGASLFVFYGGPGYTDQVISDFTYSAENGSGTNIRDLAGITSVGGTATLHMAGPDGQSNAGEQVRIVGSSTLALDNSWDGSAPQDAPTFFLGSLWDNDVVDVSSILPAGQTTLQVGIGSQGDCTGLSAVALSVQQ